MNVNCIYCIEKYIRHEYRGGGLIGISDLADYCKVSEGQIYVALVQLKQQKAVEIVKRYHCPQAHSVPFDEYPYCSECDYPYAEDFITTLIYIKPLKLDKKAYSA